MASFILAAIVLILTLGIGFMGLLASAMSDAPNQSSGVAPFVIGGIILACIIASSHWWAAW